MSEASYVKRYRMERGLRDLPPEPDAPPEYSWIAWRPDQTHLHAAVKFQSFRDEFDAWVFPSLSTPNGCCDLMQAIVTKAAFVPEATWLLAGPFGPCATVQGLRDKWHGAIQNLGVVPDHRGRGLGRLMLLKALHGFRRAGLQNAYLEVTARNLPAIRLYRQFGFRSTRTIYRALNIVPALSDCVMI